MVSLLVVGSVAFDALESPYGKVDRALGGAATYFAIAASFFTHVNLVGIVGDDFTEVDAQIFHGRTIDIDGLERAIGKNLSIHFGEIVSHNSHEIHVRKKA